MRTIILNSNIIDDYVLKESVLRDALPKDMIYAAACGKTSLGKNPIIPQIEDDAFIENILLDRFQETKDALTKIGKIDDFDDENAYTMLDKLITKCQEIERPNRDALQKLCENILVDAFSLPDDALEIDVKLVDEVSEREVNIDPVQGNEVIADSIDEIKLQADEVYKRRFINCLVMGGALRMATDLKYFLHEVYEINPKLPELYGKIIALNDYLLFDKENLHISSFSKQLSAFCDLRLGSRDKMSLMTVEGKIFPFLLTEAIRGCLELFTAHGLPEDVSERNTLLKKCDYLKAEPWNMRIGPAMWDKIMEVSEIEDPSVLPYFLAKLSTLPSDRFISLMQNALAHTIKGKALMDKMVKKSEKDKRYGDFENKMRQRDISKSILNDEEYILPDEL